MFKAIFLTICLATAAALPLAADTVASPTFFPETDTIYYEPIDVMISCATDDAVIYYTTDGTPPDQTDSLYHAPISISQSIPIRARAYLTGWQPSPIVNANYQITGTVSTPSINPASGTYVEYSGRVVTIVCADSSATIRFTLDESDPTSDSQIYTDPFLVQQTTTVKAKAYRTDWLPSGIANSTITLKAYTPQVSVLPDTYTEILSVTLYCSTTASTIRYTLDDSDPGINSPIYEGPITIAQSTTLKTRAYRNGWETSDLGSYHYNLMVATPTFSVPAGCYSESQSVIISTATTGASVFYTTDGSDPSYTSNLYYSPVSINTITPLKARAYKEGWTRSELASAIYELVVMPPVASPAGGTYQSAQTVSLNSPTSGSSIYYSTDGSDPNQGSTPYTVPITVNQNMTLKARSFKANWTSSGIMISGYEFVVATPQANPAPDTTFTSAVTVSLSCTSAPPDTIRYTTDGSEPNSSSPAYQNPIIISQTTLLKARAYKTGWTESQVFSGLYLVTGQVNIYSPVFDPPGGLYTDIQEIILNTNTYPTGAILRYTLNGPEPTASSPTFAEPIVLSLDSETTIKVKAFLSSWAPSMTYSAHYQITGQVQLTDIELYPDPGVYTFPVNVELDPSGMTPGAELRYTLDGSVPELSSSLYADPIPLPLNSHTTIRIRAFKQDWEPSRVVDASYQITGNVSLLSVQLTPPPGTYIGGQYISMISATYPTDAILRYTRDGSIPDSSSPVYTSPLYLEPDGEYTLRFKAFKDNWESSQVQSFSYRTVSYPAQLNLNADFSFDGTARKNYRLVALPGLVNHPVEWYMQGENGYDWKLFREPGSGDLLPWSPDGDFTFTPGMGYWMLSKKPVKVNIAVASVALDDQLGYSIPIHSGWNIISNPFNKAVPWSVVQDANLVGGAVIPDSLYLFENGVWMETGQLEPQRGYYFRNRFPDLTQLRIPYVWEESAGSRNNLPVCTIELMGPEVNDRLLVGILPTASDTLDHLDQFAPPGYFNDYRLILEDGTFKQEFRQSPDQLFDFHIAASEWRELQLRITPTENLPNLYLWDKTDDSLLRLSGETCYPLAPLHNNFALVCGSSAFVQDLQQDLVPQVLKIDANRPNPFRDVTSIKASFNESATVKAEVFNLRGQLVALLAEQEIMGAGSVAWTFDSSGQASGIYLCRVSWRAASSSGSKTLRMTCIK